MQQMTLTAKQQQCYDAVRSHMTTHGAAPTVQELMRTLGASSPRAITQYLEVLERKGYIARSRYAHRGIQLTNASTTPASERTREQGVMVPVLAAAGCDNLNILAQQTFDEYVCVPRELMNGRTQKQIVSIRAVGSSMEDAGISAGDYVLVEVTSAVQENDLVVAIIDSCAVIKKMEILNNAVILKPVSSDPQYKPIILHRDFRMFGRVLDVIRTQQEGDVEIVPLVSEYGR